MTARMALSLTSAALQLEQKALTEVLNRCPRSFEQHEANRQTDNLLIRKALSLGGAHKHTIHALNVFKSKNQTTRM